MVSELHTELLKYMAIIGLVPYMIRSNGQRKQKWEQQQKKLQHLVAFEHRHYRYQQHHHKDQSIANHHNRTLRWQQIYTGALIVANMITTLFGVIFLPFEDSLFVSNVVSITVFLVQIVVVNLILLETMLTYKRYCELLNNYERVRTLMKQLLQIQLCKKEVRQRQWRKYGFYILTVYGSLLATATVISMNYYYGYFWYALFAIFIIRARSIQICLYMDYIVYYLELLNIKLKALISCKLYKNYALLDIDYTHLESFEYLCNIKYVYQEIYALHEKYNELYGQSLVSIFTVVVLDIIINVYWTFLTLFEYYKSYFMYITISSLTALFINLFMLCYTGEQCEKQSSMVLISLKRLLNTSTAIKNTDCYNALLQSFLMQIIKNPLAISANSYFSVNLKTLTKILTNIVTYLVILLQFRKASSGSDELARMSFNTTDIYETLNNMEVNLTKEN